MTISYHRSARNAAVHVSANGNFTACGCRIGDLWHEVEPPIERLCRNCSNVLANDADWHMMVAPFVVPMRRNRGAGAGMETTKPRRT